MLCSQPLLGQIAYHKYAWENTARGFVSKSNVYQTTQNGMTGLRSFPTMHGSACIALSCWFSAELNGWPPYTSPICPLIKVKTNLILCIRGEEPNAHRLRRSHGLETHLIVVCLSSAFEVISLPMLPVRPELRELCFNCSQRNEQMLRSNRFNVKGITVIWIQKSGRRTQTNHPACPLQWRQQISLMCWLLKSRYFNFQ